MLELLPALLLAATTAAAAPPPALDIAAHLEVRGGDQTLVFTISNSSREVQVFDQAWSPCAASELVSVVFVGEGGIGRFIERLPLIADTITRRLSVRPHGTYECTFNLSHWYYDRIPKHEQAILLWSFKPEQPGVFSQPLYGGALLMQHAGTASTPHK